MAVPVAQEQEALGGGFHVVADRELWEVDVGERARDEVEEAAAGAVGVVGEHDPAARAEAAVEVTALAWVSGAGSPVLAGGAEAEVLGHVVAEQPVGDVVQW